MSPIKAENLSKYAADWAAIRERILKRADNACELCFVRNGDNVYRDDHGEPFHRHHVEEIRRCNNPAPPWTQKESIRIVLTIAHINQDPGDNRPTNLRALCQRCHNLIDLPYRQLNAAATRAAKRALS